MKKKLQVGDHRLLFGVGSFFFLLYSGERKGKGREEKKGWRFGQSTEIVGNRLNSDLGRVASRSFKN